MVASDKKCRDCGNVLPQKARGCQCCALNLEAENMIERFIWRRLAPGVLFVGLAAAVLVYWLR